MLAKVLKRIRQEVKEMCEKLLANTVIENYEVELKK
jgi:phosphoribosylformylglycinamidine synthase PurS subunit